MNKKKNNLKKLIAYQECPGFNPIDKNLLENSG